MQYGKSTSRIASSHKGRSVYVLLYILGCFAAVVCVARGLEATEDRKATAREGGARPADTVFVPDAVSANRCRFIEDENGDVILEFLKGFTLFIR